VVSSPLNFRQCRNRHTSHQLVAGQELRTVSGCAISDLTSSLWHAGRGNEVYFCNRWMVRWIILDQDLADHVTTLPTVVSRTLRSNIKLPRLSADCFCVFVSRCSCFPEDRVLCSNSLSVRLAGAGSYCCAQCVRLVVAFGCEVNRSVFARPRPYHREQ
jgi:hypothetical protein